MFLHFFVALLERLLEPKPRPATSLLHHESIASIRARKKVRPPKRDPRPKKHPAIPDHLRVPSKALEKSRANGGRVLTMGEEKRGKR